MATSPVTVIWHKNWSDRPVCRPEGCRHEGDRVLTINQRLVPHGKGKRMAADGVICMDCGSDALGKLGLVEGLEACMDEHGWHRGTGLRLYDLVEFRREELVQASLVPLWFCSAWNLSGAEIVAALNSSVEQVPA